MPFLAPFAPAIIGGASSIFGSLLGNKSAKKQQQAQNDYTQQLLAQQREQSAREKQIFDQYAAPNLDQAQEIFKQLLGTYQGLLGNDPSSMLLQNQLLGPGRDARARALQSQIGQISEFSPRGGAQSSLLGNARMRATGDNAQDLLGMKGMALGKMGDLGSAFAGLGGQNLGVSAGMGNSLLGSLLGARGQDMQAQQASADRSTGMWNGVGQIGGQLLGGWLNRRKGGGGSWGSLGGKIGYPGGGY
jgi:hypothetical protein